MGKTELKLEIDAELLAQAKASGLNLASVLEAELRHKLSSEGGEEQARLWAEQNSAAINEHNQGIQRSGLFGDQFRKW